MSNQSEQHQQDIEVEQHFVKLIYERRSPYEFR